MVNTKLDIHICGPLGLPFWPTSKFQPPVPGSAQDKDRTVAFITKGWAGGAQELFTSANSFYVAGLGSFLGIGGLGVGPWGWWFWRLRSDGKSPSLEVFWWLMMFVFYHIPVLWNVLNPSISRICFETIQKGINQDLKRFFLKPRNWDILYPTEMRTDCGLPTWLLIARNAPTKEDLTTRNGETFHKNEGSNTTSKDRERFC